MALQLHLLDLPSELLSAILGHLLRPAHLAQVSLVCKQTRQAALPRLYQDISINVNEWTPVQVERFTQRGHPGHRHVRSLDIDSEDIDEEDEALKVAKDVLQALPRDGLRAFRCPLEDGVDNDLMILLAARQRQLRSICIGPLQPHAFNLIDALKPWPPSIETIIVPWRLLSTEDYSFYRELIERSRQRLKALTVRVQYFAWLPGDDEQACEKLARGLFGHDRNEAYHRSRLQLRDINFQNQDLSAFDRTWSQYIDLSRLRTIQVWNCGATDSMLRCLIDLATLQPLELEGLVLSFEERDHAPLLTEELLRRTKGLEYLNMCCVPSVALGSAQQGFQIESLSAHADTLQDIYLGCGSNSNKAALSASWVSPLDDIRWLSKHCRKLKQLATPMPDIGIEEAVAGCWPPAYLAALHELANLPRLKVLRILTWPAYHWRTFWPTDPEPDANSAPQIRPEHRKLYLDRLDVFADRIARLFAAMRGDDDDRLSVIMFGHAERHDNVTNSARRIAGPRMAMSKPATYKIRCRMSDSSILQETARIDPADMRYEEPIAFVFDEDTDQGLSLESYPWGEG